LPSFVGTVSSPPAHPGVRFPPPLLFLLGFAVGLLLHRLWPLALLPGGPSRASLIAAWGLGALGFGLGGWALWTFARARTAIFPHAPAAQIVAHGPYRFSRNPMYVSLTLAYLGFALGLDVLWPPLLLPVVFAALWRFVVRKEERYLAAAFPEAYAAYRARVRRWL